MQIHIVQPNQTLATIATQYSVSIPSITEANELPNPDQLVVGQALVIPIVGSFYWVQQGDSLWAIGRKFGIPYEELARINGIVNQPLTIGMRLYIPQKQKTQGEFLAYVEPLGGTVSRST